MKQSASFSFLPIPVFVHFLNGAGERTRTSDLLFTKQLLYQLSYSGKLTACEGTFKIYVGGL